MERILSEQFVSTFLIPYLKGKILANAEKDPILQKIFASEEPLKNEERSALRANYFKDTGTIFDKDLNLRDVFWGQFTQFVRRQKKICSDNIRLLAFRTLPDPVTKEFSNEAQQNLLKFGYQVANAVQDYRISQLIRNKQLSGEITNEKALDLKSKLGQGKLVMVKDKNGQDKILEDEEIKRALANVAFQADLYSAVETSGEGEELLVYPDEVPAVLTEGQPAPAGKGMTLSNLELEIYEKQATKIEVMLEDAGMYVEAKMKPDKTGMVRGYVVDKKTRERMLVEVNANKPDSKFRFTFVEKPAKTFMADRKEIKKYFKDENKSADEIYDMKEKEKMENPLPYPAKAPEEPKKKSAAKEVPAEGLGAVSPLPSPEAKGDLYARGFAAAIPPKGIMAAKEKFLRKIIRESKIKYGTPVGGGYKKGPSEAERQPVIIPDRQEVERRGEIAVPVQQPPPAAPRKTLDPAKLTGKVVAGVLGGSCALSLILPTIT